MKSRGVVGAALFALTVGAAAGLARASVELGPPSNAEILSEPLRFYQPDDAQSPATGFVGLVFDFSEKARWGLLHTDYSDFTFHVPDFCQRQCKRGECFWHCLVGLYYVWPADSYDNWQPRYTVQASDNGEWSKGLDEANLSCDVNGSSGCPCWLLPRADPLARCDVRPDQNAETAAVIPRSDGGDGLGLSAAPIQGPFPVPVRRP